MVMKIRVIPVTPFQQNCSMLICEPSKVAAVVDPGGELDRIIAIANEEQVEIKKIFLTHAHIDHAGGAAELSEKLAIPIEGPHRDDQFWIDMLEEQARMFNFPAVRPFQPDRWLSQGDTVEIGQISLDVYHCPGHTPGHVVFYQSGLQIAIVGDVLFQGSIGRTDFPKGDHATLIRSIREKLWPLGDEVQFLPGHGPGSTFGYERLTNPFLSDK
ncbi:MAG: MBL fold metallo-hydrolase [Gammaproteobacteria bacterium]|nr:MBL fold metallo-hydrolase [Gammaproteobacteria bacterium]